MKEIPLSQGYVALVDDEDFESLSRYKWCALVDKRNVYAVRSEWIPSTKKKTTIRMHRQLMGCPENVDHADSNSLNNQRYNLRKANDSQNQGNCRKHVRRSGSSSAFKGVSWTKRVQKWQAFICANGRSIHLGYFRDECDAAQAYNFAALEAFGEFARFNTPISPEIRTRATQ